MATRVVSCSAAPQPQTRRGLLAGVGVGVGLATMGLERGAQAAGTGVVGGSLPRSAAGGGDPHPHPPHPQKHQP